MAPKPMLYVPRSGELPKELRVKHRFAANCGCWLYSHGEGASTYDEIADYPARPMMTEYASIQPFYYSHTKGKGVEYPKIEIRSINI